VIFTASEGADSTIAGQRSVGLTVLNASQVPSEVFRRANVGAILFPLLELIDGCQR
jgi:hypothetical protein